MGRIIYAEESILDYLHNLSKVSTFSTGLILGQSSQQKDYVILLTQTPKQFEVDKAKEGEEPPAEPIEIKSVKEIQEAWIADHAKHVTRMLPGGLWVLGAFVCSSSDIFNEVLSQAKLKSVLFHMMKLLSCEPLLHANSPLSERLLLHFNTVDKRYVCKTLEVNSLNSAFKSAEWKFQNNFTKWIQISCNYNLDQPSIGGNTSSPLKSQLKDVLNQVNEKIVKGLVVIKGDIQSENETLESILTEKQKSISHETEDSEEKSVLEASVCIPSDETASEGIVLDNCNVELQLLGSVASQVFLHHKTTVSEAVNAIKQDIVRSLAARLEMHWDSLVEEEYGSPEEKQSIHEPPRRVSVSLPTSKISFSDYLFPGEGPSEVVLSFKELLDLTISETDVQGYEIQGDPTELYVKSSVSVESSSSDDMLRPSLPMGLLITALAFAVVLIGIAIALHTQRSEKPLIQRDE